MSYPFIGLPGIVPDDRWDAGQVEDLLRSGKHIFFEDVQGPIGTAKFTDEEFVFEGEDGGRRFGSKSFLEFAAFCAFYGRDFL
jgi:hypothetical protein